MTQRRSALWPRVRARRARGTLVTLPDVPSAELGNRRDLTVWLPPAYSRAERRYPVIYMHDGQNLFDPRTSYAEPWRVDTAMERAGKRSLEAIVVGIPNMGADRLAEYSPYVDAKVGGGKGDLYLDWIIGTVKPLVDAGFRTRPDRAHTGMVGSSMGGLITLYAYLRNPIGLRLRWRVEPLAVVRWTQHFSRAGIGRARSWSDLPGYRRAGRESRVGRCPTNARCARREGIHAGQ